MDIAQLETFLAIVEERGFGRAATRLHRTQPAVSQTVRRLEEELGEKLFERGKRDGTLTSAGDVLRGYAERMLRLRGEAASAVGELRTLQRGRLLIAANEYTSHLLLPILAQYRQSSPQVELVVQRALASRIPDELLARGVELGVLSFPPDHEGLTCAAVYEDDVSFIVDPQHPFARDRGPVSVRDLGAQNFIAHATPSPLRKSVLELFARYRTPLHMGVQLPSLEAVKRFVATGAGVAIMPNLTVLQEMERGELVRIPVPEFAWKRRLWLVWRTQGTLSHAARALLRQFRNLASEQGRPYLWEEENRP